MPTTVIIHFEPFQVMYITATFPYAVTTIFLIRSIMLDGAMDGLTYMLSPDVSGHNWPDLA